MLSTGALYRDRSYGDVATRLCDGLMNDWSVERMTTAVMMHEQARPEVLLRPFTRRCFS